MENIIVAKFNVESEAYQALSELKRNAVNEECIISQLAVVKKKENNIEIQDSFDTGVTSEDDSMAGGIIGGLIGILSGPVGVLFYGSLGALIGSTIDTEDVYNEYKEIEHICNALIKGETAIIALAQEKNEEVLNAEFKKFDTEVLRFDAAKIMVEIDEIDEQRKIEEKEIRKEKKEQFIAERKEKINLKREKIKEKFSKIKNK